MFQRVAYDDLNARQKENRNFQKVAACLADYGFNCLRLTDDWQGADFLACHIDGETVLKVQLKGRATIDRKYLHKDIHIAFLLNGDCCLYEHDALVHSIEEQHPSTMTTESWLGKKANAVGADHINGFARFLPSTTCLSDLGGSDASLCHRPSPVTATRSRASPAAFGSAGSAAVPARGMWPALGWQRSCWPRDGS